MARGGLRGRGCLVSFIEQHSIDYVPIAERHGKVWHLWPVWFSGDAHLATVATGIVGVALGGNFAWMVIAVIFGSAFGTFFMAFHSTQGPQLGLPQMIQSRPQFGYVGYAQFEPDYTTPIPQGGTPIPQVATLQPFTVMIQYKNNF